jgi:hypothetical protein
MHSKLFCIVALILTSTAYCADVTYTFHVNLALNATEAGSAYAPQQLESLRGYEIWRDWWNAQPADARTTKYGDTFLVELVISNYSSYGYTGAQYQGMNEAYTNSTADFQFAPTDWDGVGLRQYAYSIGINLMMSPSDSSEAYYNVPGSFGSPTANILVMSEWPSYLLINGAKTISIIEVPDGVYQSEMCSGLYQQAILTGLTVVDYFTDMPFDWDTLGQVVGPFDPYFIATVPGIENRTNVWMDVMDQVIESNVDAVVVCDYTYGAAFALNYTRSKGWNTKFFGVSPINSEVSDMSLFDYVVLPLPYSSSARYPSQVNFTNSPGYNALAQSTYGTNATFTMAQSTLAGMLLSDAIRNSPTNATSDIISTLSRSQFQSFMGTSAFDVDNRQIITPLMSQLANSGNTTYIVGPPIAASSNLIYPMPTWDERVFSPKWGSGVEIAGVVLVSIAVLVDIVWAILLIVHWNHKVIVAASPIFCLIILAGDTINNASMFTWMPSLVGNTICSLRPVLLPIGFMTLFGPLIAKTHRIYRIFGNISLEAKGIRNAEVGLIVLAILVVQSILSILSTTITDLHAHLFVQDAYRISLNHYVCTFSDTLKAIMGVNIAYAVGLLGWGTYLAYRINNIPNLAPEARAMYDESRPIMLSVYNTILFATVVVIIQCAVGDSNKNLTFMVTAACTSIGGFVTTVMLFLPKFNDIYQIFEWSSTSGSSRPSSSPLSGRKSSVDSSSEVRRLKKKLEQTEKQNKKLEAELQTYASKE